MWIQHVLNEWMNIKHIKELNPLILLILCVKYAPTINMRVHERRSPALLRQHWRYRACLRNAVSSSLSHTHTVINYWWNRCEINILSISYHSWHKRVTWLLIIWFTISLYLHAKDTNSVYFISDIITLTSSSFLMKKQQNNGLFYLLFLPKRFRASCFMITHFYRNECTLNHCGMNSWTELYMTQSHFISSLKLLHIITFNRYGKLIKNNYWLKYE